MKNHDPSLLSQDVVQINFESIFFFCSVSKYTKVCVINAVLFFLIGLSALYTSHIWRCNIKHPTLVLAWQCTQCWWGMLNRWWIALWEPKLLHCHWNWREKDERCGVWQQQEAWNINQTAFWLDRWAFASLYCIPIPTGWCGLFQST